MAGRTARSRSGDGRYAAAHGARQSFARGSVRCDCESNRAADRRTLCAACSEAFRHTVRITSHGSVPRAACDIRRHDQTGRATSGGRVYPAGFGRRRRPLRIGEADGEGSGNGGPRYRADRACRAASEGREQLDRSRDSGAGPVLAKAVGRQDVQAFESVDEGCYEAEHPPQDVLRPQTSRGFATPAISCNSGINRSIISPVLTRSTWAPMLAAAMIAPSYRRMGTETDRKPASASWSTSEYPLFRSVMTVATIRDLSTMV